VDTGEADQPPVSRLWKTNSLRGPSAGRE